MSLVKYFKKNVDNFTDSNCTIILKGITEPQVNPTIFLKRVETYMMLSSEPNKSFNAILDTFNKIIVNYDEFEKVLSKNLSQYA